MEEEEMGNWSELPTDVLDLVANRLTVSADRARFSGACRNWYSLAKSIPNYLPCQPPWLMLVENPDSNRRGFAGLTDAATADKESFDLNLPETKGTRCLSSTGCWVVMVDAECKMFILNPFTKAKIELPPLRAFDGFKEFYSRNPRVMTNLFLQERFISGNVHLSFPITKSPAEAFIALAIFGRCNSLAYTSKGANSWTTIDTNNNFIDVQFYQGKYYAVNGAGTVFEFSISFSSPGKPTLKSVSDTLMDYETGERYLVESEGMLLPVVRYVRDIGEEIYTPGSNVSYCDYKTHSVHVFELDFLTGGWVKVNDLGQRTIFAGFNNCVSLLATSSSTFKPNCIYFTDDYRLGYHLGSPFLGGRDMVVYNLADGTIEPHYTGRYSLSSSSPPTWIIPTSMYHSKG